MSRRSPRTFLLDQSASVTVEFVVVMWFFVLITFFVIEIALVQFWWQTAEKAAQIGARLAVVADPAVASTSSTCPAAANSLPLINCINTGNSSAAAGFQCTGSGSSTDQCVDYGTITCTGGDSSCNATAFNYIVNRMRQTYLPIQNGNVVISYSYKPALGYAGGPSEPAVTVTITGLRFGIISILGNLIGTGGDPFTTVPDMSVTITGEDLNSSQPS
jgi:hypothetical protein